MQKKTEAMTSEHLAVLLSACPEISFADIRNPPHPRIHPATIATKLALFEIGQFYKAQMGGVEISTGSH